MHFYGGQWRAVLGCLVLFSIPSWAARSFNRNHWNVRLGLSVSNLLQRMEAPAGFESKVSQVQGLLGVQRQISFSPKWGISPDVHVWFPWRNGADGTTFVVTSHFSAPVFWEPWKFLQLFLGPGLFWESYFSKEEAISLGNGGGSSTFYTPWRSRQVLLLSAFGGTKIQFSKKMGIFLGLWVPQFTHSEKRRFHAVGGISIRL